MNESAFSADTLIYIVNALAAGIWLGGLIFTTTVVSPAFKRMAWAPSERIAVRSEVGKQYAKVARVNLAILLITALIDGAMRGWSIPAWIEITLIFFILTLSELHARVLAPRLGAAARSDDVTKRQKVLRLSISVSMLNLLLSFIVAVLALVPVRG